ncbi:MAG: hypothetical protein JWO47_37 [Candidatus Saccharibacteria bacterium]|nr:hypothetical protein [Candidatus Saccharibacteria bacterium]
MIEIDRGIVIAHRAIRPIAGARQVSPERLLTLKRQAIGREDTPSWQNKLEWLKLVGVGAVRPAATASYEHALGAASKIANRCIIGAGLEAIVARDGRGGSPTEVTKYATKVNGDPRYWRDELTRRYDKAKGVMGEFVVDTEYELGGLRGRTEPSLIIMRQPYIKIVGNAHRAGDMADQIGEFKELAEKLASDKEDPLYFDLMEYHDNLIVHQDAAGGRHLREVDMVIMSANDKVRPFVSIKPDPIEWASSLHNLAPAA